MKVILRVHGVVQGVGYRYFVWRVAKRHGIVGTVRNLSDGSVEIVAVGTKDALSEFEKDIQVGGEYGPQVMHIERKERIGGDEAAYSDFKIVRDG